MYSNESITRPTLVRIVVGVAVLFFCINLAQVYKLTAVNEYSDFNILYQAAKAFGEGQNPYLERAHDLYFYPQFFTVFLYPFTFLPVLVAHIVWYVVSLASLYGAVTLMTRMVGIGGDKHIQVIGITGLLFISVIQLDVMTGNINCFLLFILMMGLALSDVRTSPFDVVRRMPMWLRVVQPSLWIAIGIGLKFAPIVLSILPALHWRGLQGRRFPAIWRNILPVLALCLAVMILCLGLPYLIHGNNSIVWYQYWWKELIEPAVQKRGGSSQDYTLAGMIAESLLHKTFAPLWLKALCGAFLTSFIAWLSYRRNYVSAYCLALMIMPMTGTHSYPFHFIMVIPAMVLWCRWMLMEKGLWFRGVLIEFTRGRKTILWTGLVLLQLCLLWGNDVKKFPLDNLALLLLYLLIFWVSTTQIGHIAREDAP
jgi:hypothetical protein